MATLSYEALAQKAPTVAFVHSFPGPVKSGIARDTKGLAMFTFKAMFALLGPLLYIPNEESGERHLYLCTSGRYPAREGVEEAVSVEKNVGVARGTDGAVGGGVYSVDQNGEGAGVRVREVLAGLREKGVLETVWKDSEEQFKRITGEVVMA